MAGTAETRKPRLVFFQWDHAPNLVRSKFLTVQMQDHVKCLAEFFDVTVVNDDCDYGAVCDRYHSDICLFEGGYRTHGSRPIAIRNVRAHPQIPKLGLHNGDAWCDRRAGYLSDMDAWGIETHFTIATAMPEYTPALAGKLYVWPNFIDPDLFRDYGLQKVVPVMLTGQTNGLYPWRKDVYKLLAENFPCLISPAYGYESRSAARMLSGERYARAINSAFFVPTCGTMGRELVRKHLEIPGARSCMLAERTPILEAAGFVDMVNCVFVDKSDVIDRVDYLFDNPALLAEITDAGHALVHARHTFRNRRQIRDWFDLRATLMPEQRIVQPDPFAPLEVVEARASLPITVQGQGKDRALLVEGDRRLANGDVVGARTCFDECLRYVSYLPEARLRLALCSLHQGDSAAAVAELAGLLEVSTVLYKGGIGADLDPDPVEWSMFLLALICSDRISDARRLLRRYPRLNHPELDHVAHMLGVSDRGSVDRTDSKGQNQKPRLSIHHVPERSEAEWRSWCASLLVACRQSELAQAVRQADLPMGKLSPARRFGGLLPRDVLPWRAALDQLVKAANIKGLRPAVPATADFRYIDRLVRNAALALLPGSIARRLRQIRAERATNWGQRIRHIVAAVPKAGGR